MQKPRKSIFNLHTFTKYYDVINTYWTCAVFGTGTFCILNKIT